LAKRGAPCRSTGLFLLWMALVVIPYGFFNYRKLCVASSRTCFASSIVFLRALAPSLLSLFIDRLFLTLLIDPQVGSRNTILRASIYSLQESYTLPE